MQEDSPRFVPPLVREDGRPAPSAADEARVIRSEDLFAGARVVMIQHAHEHYRLLITCNNRLNLQK